MAGLLGKTGTYKLLLFALENPRPCAHVLSCSVSDPQRSLLQEWVLTARSRPSTGAIATSRDLLRNELQTKLKAKVLQKLESIYVDTGSSLSD
jgi:eukaryotic-like serine/threonine-protein kinase